MADTTINNLTELTTVADDDVIAIVDDTGGTPITKKITKANLVKDIAIANGGTGQTTQQAAIDALTDVSSTTNEFVLTKDTATGNAIFKVAAGGGAGGFQEETFVQDGAVPTGTIGYMRIRQTGTIDDARSTVAGVSGTVSEFLKVDIRKNGTATTDSIFTSDVAISIEGNDGASNDVFTATGTLDTGAGHDDVTAGDVLWIIVTENSMSPASTDLTVRIAYTPS